MLLNIIQREVMKLTDTLKLKAAIVASGLSRKEVAALAGMSAFSLHKKLHNTTEFKASEIDCLSKILNITDLQGVFFAPNVSKYSTYTGDASKKDSESG